MEKSYVGEALKLPGNAMGMIDAAIMTTYGNLCINVIHAV